MPVTRDDVRHAYRLLLDREPENESVIARLMDTPNPRALREIFLTSQEYLRSDSFAEHRVGDYFADPAQTVEVAASPR